MHLYSDYIRSARIFISYTREDRAAKERLAEELGDRGFRVFDDSRIERGDYRRVIEDEIAASAALVVIWTATAARSAWVNNEIGFARGRGVYVFYASVDGEVPTGILDHQASPIEDTPRILRDTIASALAEQAASPRAARTVRILRSPEARSRELAEAAGRLREPQLLRQIAIYSTFGVPDQAPSIFPEPWQVREGATPRTEEHREAQYQGRLRLEAHAREAGARLILSPQPLVRGAVETRARLETLRRFLAGEGAARVAVLLSGAKPRGNRTLLGDRLSAWALAASAHGFAHTVMTEHAATVLAEVKRFDDAWTWPALDDLDGMRRTREAAIERIDEVLGGLGNPGG